MTWSSIASELVRKAAYAALEMLYAASLGAASLLLACVIITVCAGWAGRLLRRRGRVPSTATLGGTLALALAPLWVLGMIFMVFIVRPQGAPYISIPFIFFTVFTVPAVAGCVIVLTGAAPQPDEACGGRLPDFEQAHAGTRGQCGRPPPLATPRYVDHDAQCVFAGQVRCRCAVERASSTVRSLISARESQT